MRLRIVALLAILRARSIDEGGRWVPLQRWKGSEGARRGGWKWVGLLAVGLCYSMDWREWGYGWWWLCTVFVYIYKLGSKIIISI